jgi:hypothetical protein
VYVGEVRKLLFTTQDELLSQADPTNVSTTPFCVFNRILPAAGDPGRFAIVPEGILKFPEADPVEIVVFFN